MSEADINRSFPAHLASVAARTDDALAAGGYDALAIFSGRPANHFLDDSGWPFKVNPHFKLWAPLSDAPDSFICHVPGRRPALCFYQPADYWHRPPQLPTAEWLAEFDVHTIREPGEARAVLAAALGRARTVFIGEWQPEFADWGFAAANPPTLLAHLHYWRAVKTPYELACMRQASRIGARAHLAARDAFLAGASEFEVHVAYCAASGLTEAELPYQNIIAFNEGAAVLHNHSLERSRNVPRRSFLIDAGAQFRGYACDITRTYSGGDPEFTALIEGVDTLQRRLCDAVRAGRDYREVHLEAHRLIGALLHEAGVISCSAETAVADGVTSVFFPHGLGHLLGLQVHDVAGFAADVSGREIPKPDGHPYLRLTRRLEPGFVVTIEPGVYFIPLLLEAARAGSAGHHIRWNAVERLSPYGGIRVEDDVACTAAEPENLTRDAFAEGDMPHSRRRDL
jgi:Xaa-Pro dipeptidase